MSNDALPDRSHRRWYVVEGYADLVRILVVVAEILVLLLVTIVALYFQINERPKIPKIYHTNDPFDPVIGKESYACGCNLPATIQRADNPSTNSNSSIDRCYDKSELKTVQVMMFPKAMTGAKLRPVLNAFVRPEQVYNKTLSEGYFFGHEAHDLYGEVVQDPLKDDIKTLFFNGNRLVDYYSSVSYMRDNLISFPKSFLRLAFSYNCTDCDTCALGTINNISTAVSNDETWGTCYMWGSENQCPRSYQAKCSLYPTKSLPTNFAIRGFFERLLNLSGIEETDIHPVSPTYDHFNSSTSLQPSSLYLDLKQIEKSSIEMRFVEVVRGSAFWVSVRNLFPGMDISCSNVSKVVVCNGTSVCNVFTNDNSTDNYKLKCKDLVNRTECLSLMKGSTADNVEYLRQGSEINWDDVNCGMANRTPQCFNITPHLVTYNISQRMAGNPDALNEFVYDNILQEEWAQQAGVCINTFDDVYRYAPNISQDDSGSGNKLSGESDIKYLETQCTSNYLGNAYCWLTGHYHDVTDDPLEWKNLTRDPRYPGVPPSERFVCYRVDKQSMMTWSILTFGAIFGWIGTVHLIFQFFRSLIDKLARRLEGHTCCLQWGLFRSISETNATLDSGSMSATSSDSSQTVWPHPSVFKRSSSVSVRDSM